MKRPVDVHVGQRVRQRRWMVGMTLQQLGDRVGIKRQQIQKYETGTCPISASRMWDIAAAMTVPVSFFFEGLDGRAGNTGEAHGDIRRACGSRSFGAEVSRAAPKYACGHARECSALHAPRMGTDGPGWEQNLHEKSAMKVQERGRQIGRASCRERV